MTPDKVIYVTHFQRERMSGPVVGRVLLELGSVKSESVQRLTQHASLAARVHM